MLYIRKASPGIVLRDRADYQVLACRRTLSADVICVAVGTFDEYNTLNSAPDVIGLVYIYIYIFISRLQGRYATVSTVDLPYA